MKPYHEEPGVLLFHGDCREVIPVLRDMGFRYDLLLTDPPYGMAYESGFREQGDPMGTPIAGDDDSGAFLLGMAAIHAAGLMKMPHHRLVFCQPRRLNDWLDILRAPAALTQVLAWDKGDRGTAGDLECGFAEAWEAIVYQSVGRKPLNPPRPRTIIRHDWNSTLDPVHPAVKPVALMERLIRTCTAEGEWILDPFCGSGPVLAAARRARRPVVGIEIEERYCEATVNRLAQGEFTWA